MRFLVTILWIQVTLGAVGMCASSGYAHWAAMTNAWWAGFEDEFRTLQRSSEFREPPLIKGYSYARVIDAHRSSARVRREMATYSLAFSGIVTGVALLLLLRVHQLKRLLPVEHRNAEPGAPPNGGPATPVGNAGATKGPPSVS